MKLRLIVLVVLSAFLTFEAVYLLLQHQFTRSTFTVAFAAFTGWCAVACRGRLPNWLKKRWNVVDEAPPGSVPIRVWLPLLAIITVVVVLLLLYAVRP